MGSAFSKPVAALLALMFSASLLTGQSGRKVTPTPTPTPASAVRTGVAQESVGFSESKPSTRRRAQVQERFPGIGGIPQQPEPKPASTSPANPAGIDEGEVLRVETNLITIPVSVFDRNGLYIPGLRQEDFKIFEDNVEQEIAYFGTTDKPFTVALVIDVSPSTAYKIDEIQRAAAAFVGLLEPQDSVIVISFDSSVNVLSQATKDREKIYKAIKKADFGGGTSLYNAVDEALRKQLGKVTGRKAVVLFTDGVDTTSRKNSYDSTLNFAEESDSLIFPIYYDTFIDNNSMAVSRGISAGMSASEYALGRKYLEEISEVTGGRVFRPDTTPGGLTRAFEGIAEELRRQYNVGYVPKESGKVGQRKQIRVRVNKPNLIIRARDSYIVGAGTAAAPQTPAKN